MTVVLSTLLTLLCVLSPALRLVTMILMITIQLREKFEIYGGVMRGIILPEKYSNMNIGAKLGLKDSLLYFEFLFFIS